MKFRTSFLRGGGALAALVLFFAAGAMAETTNTLSDAEIQGRQLAQQLCDARPTEDFTNIGTLKIRDASNPDSIVPPMAVFETKVDLTSWQNTFKAYHYKQINSTSFWTRAFELVSIIHSPNQPNQYEQFIQNYRPATNTTKFRIEDDTKSYSI